MMVSLLPSLLHAVAAQHSPNRLPPDFAEPPPPPPGTCHGGPCGGMAHYPAKPGIVYEAVFDVPELPKKQDDICFYIYFNIFFRGKGHGTMNQFVPQLMLGNSLTASSGPPEYTPKWIEHKSWVFSSQYFMEINNTKTGNPREAHAATGEAHAVKPGEKVWTRFTLDDNYVWGLKMGVVGDGTRTSTVISDKPFMGLLPESETKSWSEPEYNMANVNTCWELYGVTDADHFPSSGSRYDITISTKGEKFPAPWMSKWNALDENGFCAACNMWETHNDTAQKVTWIVEPIDAKHRK